MDQTDALSHGIAWFKKREMGHEQRQRSKP
jgi:hypothetical protein